MHKLPLQLVIIDLKNGQRGVFLGRPLVTSESEPDDSHIEQVWFTDIRELPDSMTLQQVVAMAFDPIPRSSHTLQ